MIGPVGAQLIVTENSERFLASAFEHAPVGLSVADRNGRWLRFNDAYCEMFGYERVELLDKTFRDLTHPDDLAADEVGFQDILSGTQSCFVREKRYLKRDGSTVWTHCKSQVIRDEFGDIEYTLTLVQDITKQHESDIAVRTGERLLRSILDNSPNPIAIQRSDARYQLVNSAFERQFGLQRGVVAEQLADLVLPGDLAVRDRECHDRVLRTGAAVTTDEITGGQGRDRVFRTLKFPLYDADSLVSGVCTIFSDVTENTHYEAELRERLQWTDRLHSAAIHDRFVLHGQPIVDLATGHIDKAELLVRMRDRRESAQLIMPGEFLPAAERLGIVSVVDQWVVARAVALAVRRRVEVNVSAQTISDPKEVTKLENLVLASGAPPGNIVFEITETAVAENLSSAREFADRMKAIGCEFALDDFGTGFGTFTYLKHLPVDYLKIDIEFVRNIVNDESDRQAVRAIIGVAKEYGMKTVAEGVEDERSYDYLRELNVDYAQGYWIGRPVPLSELWPTYTDRRTA